MPTEFDVALGLNLTIGSVPVALTGAVSKSESGTVYVFDGSVQHATVQLGAFLRAAMEQFGAHC